MNQALAEPSLELRRRRRANGTLAPCLLGSTHNEEARVWLGATRTKDFCASSAGNLCRRSRTEAIEITAQLVCTRSTWIECPVIAGPAVAEQWSRSAFTAVGADSRSCIAVCVAEFAEATELLRTRSSLTQSANSLPWPRAV